MSEYFLKSYIHFYYKHVRTKLVLIRTCQTMSGHFSCSNWTLFWTFGVYGIDPLCVYLILSHLQVNMKWFFTLTMWRQRMLVYISCMERSFIIESAIVIFLYRTLFLFKNVIVLLLAWFCLGCKICHDFLISYSS